MDERKQVGNTEVFFEQKEHIAVLAARDNGWNKEANVVAWNGGEPKIDIRDWSKDHEHMGRGITLTEKEAEKLAKALAQRFMEKQKNEVKKDQYER